MESPESSAGKGKGRARGKGKRGKGKGKGDAGAASFQRNAAIKDMYILGYTLLFECAVGSP